MLDKFIYFALLALLVMTPLPYGAVETWSIALWEIGIFGVVGLWALLVVQQGKLDITLNPLVWPMHQAVLASSFASASMVLNQVTRSTSSPP